MVISHRLKYIFFHVPKTAGTSIKQILRSSNFQIDTIGKWDGMNPSKLKNNPLIDWNLRQHSNIAEAKEYFEKHTDYNYDDYFKFAFIRNPWDRQVSKYEFYMQKVYYQKDVSKVNAELATSFKNLPAKQFLMNVIDKQSDFICEDNNIKVDFLGNFETLYDDMKQIISIIRPGLPDLSWSLPHQNSTNRKDYKEYYDEESKQKIQEVCKKDIELGNYTF